MRRIAATLLIALMLLSCALAESPVENSLVRIPARPDFTFARDLTNSTDGEAAPIETDYYLSKTKVTNAEYKLFIDATGHKAPNYWKNGTYPEGKADHPVVAVSYSDAAAYCEWLTGQHEAGCSACPRRRNGRMPPGVRSTTTPTRNTPPACPPGTTRRPCPSPQTSTTTA